MQRVLTTVTLLGLLVATAAAFVITEHLKLKKSPLYGTFVAKTLSPVCARPCDRTARVRIRLRHADRVTVAIVDSSGDTVDTLVSDELLSARTPHHWSWDGTAADGTRAPDGSYYPWITLNGRHTYELPNRIALDTKPPKVLSAKRLKPTLLAGKGRTIGIRYGFNEPAHALVYLGSDLVVRGRRTHGEKIKWAGTRNGRQLRAGTYVLSIGAEDIFGNVTPAVGRKGVTVVVAYVELAPERITVRSGRGFRVHVETAAKHYTWRLGQRHGSHRGKALHLRAPTTPGTYRLVVAENGHATTAVVQVRAK